MKTAIKALAATLRFVDANKFLIAFVSGLVYWFVL